MDFDVIYIGSGHACWHGALILLRAGKKVAAPAPTTAAMRKLSLTAHLSTFRASRDTGDFVWTASRRSTGAG